MEKMDKNMGFLWISHDPNHRFLGLTLGLPIRAMGNVFREKRDQWDQWDARLEADRSGSSQPVISDFKGYK